MTAERDFLAKLWQSIVAPDVDELRELAHAASAEPQRVETQLRTRRRQRGRWALGLAAAALLIASALGFGLGAWLTPSGDAGRNVVGFGFLPERGWDVVQTAGPTPGAATAVAQREGIVLSVTSTPRGDPVADVAYQIRDLPLAIADARATRDRSLLELQAGVGGYNVDIEIRFAASRPSSEALDAAQRQLNRLVVAADRVTMGLRPMISSPLTNQVTAFGTIDKAKAGESVTIQAKDCGATFFRVFSGANTEADGSWSTFIFPYVTTTLRAVWNGETSAEVIFRQRAFIGLRHEGGSRFRVNVSARSARFDGNPVAIQRFDQRLGRWEVAKRVRLTSDFYTYFALRVAKGTRLRAVFSNAQAKPCYLGATSPVIRT